MLTNPTPTEGLLWSPANFRLTTFVSEEIAGDYANWWESVTGSAPDEVKEERRISRSTVSGPWEDGELKLIVQLARIDWVYESKKELISKTIPTLGDFAAQSLVFQNAMGKWFQVSDCPSVNRLAFGVTLLHAASVMKDAFSFLNGRIPVTLYDDGSSDLLYQINRPQPSKSDDLIVINRLSKWSVITFSQQVLSAEGTLKAADIFAATLELDINTAPSSDLSLSPTNMGVLLGEFVTLAQEIAINGDKPNVSSRFE